VDEWPLVGRGGVVDRVVAAVTAGTPAAVVIAGAAGVGKTRVGREVASRLSGTGWTARTVVGTRAAATIPFAAFAGFVPAEHSDLTPLGIFGVVRASLAGSPDPSSLLVVDDAQRLDAGSAALVHHIVADRICPVVATVRSGEPAPDAVAGLWKDSLAERIELGGLAREQVDELVGAVLGGPVDGATLRRLWLATRGNLLFLRELVVGAVASGGLREVDGVWRLAGDTPIPVRLVELITDRLARLEPATRAALDVIAVAERIDVDLFGGLIDAGVVEELERLGFVDVQVDSDPGLVVLRHPLFGEAVRAEMTAVRRRRVCAELADAVYAAGMPDPGDVVRVAAWRLEAGAPADADLLTAAAQRAWMTNDHALAERLAEAAHIAGAGFDAAIVLADVALTAGRWDDALERFERLAAEASSDEQRVSAAGGRAHILAHQLDREVEAIAILDEALSTIDDDDLADGLRCRVAAIHVLAPRPLAALDVARPVLERPDSPSLYRATYAASIASALCGRLDDAVRIGERGYEAHRRLDEVVRRGAETQHIGPILALCAAGRLVEAATMAERSYESAVIGGDAESQATFALLRGHVATWQGRTVTATELFREALAVNRELDDTVGLRWALGGIALAAGLRGERRAAVAAATELAAHHPLATQILELDLVERGRAWVQVASGEFSSAVTILRDAAASAAASGQLVAEAVLRHDLARLDQARSEHQRLAELAEAIDGTLTATLAEHATALAVGDADRIDRVAHRLAELGCCGIALEAATGARTLLLAAGFRRRASAAEAFARQMIEACEGASSPLAGSFAEARLTAREREIAALAGRGLSNREIADRLVVSLRTVENHLARVFVKLGIASRRELADALERSPG
jgi:DNA-binding CsgD family transcriptional regulator